MENIKKVFSTITVKSEIMIMLRGLGQAEAEIKNLIFLPGGYEILIQ